MMKYILNYRDFNKDKAFLQIQLRLVKVILSIIQHQSLKSTCLVVTCKRVPTEYIIIDIILCNKIKRF